MPRKPLSVRLDEQLVAQVRAAANERGQKVTTFVERALKTALTVHATGENVGQIPSSVTISGASVQTRAKMDELEAKMDDLAGPVVSPGVRGPNPKPGPPSIASTWRR